MMREIQFDNAFIYKYSMREQTRAHRLFEDDVPEKVKQERLQQLLDLQKQISLKLN